MITGLTYVLSAMTLSVVLSLAASSGHEELAQGVQVFRYQRGYIRFLAGCVGVPIVMATFVYIATENRPRGFGLGMVAFGAVGAVGVYAAYRYFCSYRIELRESCLCVSAAGRDRTLSYAELLQVDLIEQGRGVRSIAFRMRDPKQKGLEISNSISDFDVLFERLTGCLEAENVPIRSRDKWGRWS
jgi:hypothetical protein